MKKLVESVLHERLVTKLNSREAYIGIVGLGYVGLPLSLTFAESGYHVIGFDIDTQKVDAINKGKSYLQHIAGERVLGAKENRLLQASLNFENAAEVDCLIICVPTPLNRFREPDLSYIHNTMNSLLPNIRPGQVLSLESTTYPGTTEEEIRPLIEKRGLTIGKDYFLVYSPEREDPGNQDFCTKNIPKVVGGSTIACMDIGRALYSNVVDEVIAVSNTRTAEMTKLLENIHRAVNIGLMNELKPLADRMWIDLYEVIRAAATKPFGFTPYYPGPGLGGHCIPIDPFYLTWKAREYDMHTRFIELAGEINTSMPGYVVQKTAEVLNNARKPINGSKILILGIAYKKNIDDTRESPSVEIMKLLNEKGAKVGYSDPYFRKFPKMRKYEFDLYSETLSPDVLAAYDAVILATDHDSFDYHLIEANSNLIIDTRGRFVLHPHVTRA